MRRKERMKASATLAQDLDLLIAQAPQLPWEVLVQRSLDLEESHIRALRKHAALTLEVQRRISEVLFQLAFRKKQPTSLCRLLFHNLKRVGFTDEERKLDMTILYARLSAEAGFTTEGAGALESLLQELQTIDGPGCQKAIHFVQSVLQDLTAE